MFGLATQITENTKGLNQTSHWPWFLPCVCTGSENGLLCLFFYVNDLSLAILLSGVLLTDLR